MIFYVIETIRFGETNYCSGISSYNGNHNLMWSTKWEEAMKFCDADSARKITSALNFDYYRIAEHKAS